MGAPGAAAHAVAFCRACTCAFPVVLLVFLAAFTSLPGRYDSHVVVRSYAGYLPVVKDEPAVFGPRVPADGVTARLEEASPKEACEALTNKYEGRWIALVQRSFGTEKCDFVTKVRTRGCSAAGSLRGFVFSRAHITRQRTLNSPRVHPIFAPAARVSRSKPDPRDSHRTTQVRNAEMAGAVAVVVFDNVDGPLIPMAKKNEDNDVNVPSVFVSKESGEALETLLNDPKHGKTVVVTLESPDSPFDDWPNVATSACVTFGALCVLLSVVLVLKRREQAHLAAMAAQRPPETRLLSAEEVAAVAKTAVFSSQERVLSFLRGATCGGAHASAGDGDGEDDKLVVDNGTGDTCAVCIEDYESGDELRALDCGHAFHKDCIDPWLITKRACCPVCKHVIAPPPPPENVPDSRRRRRSRWSVLSNASVATVGGAESADESDLEAPLLPASSPARSLRRGVMRWLTRRTAAGHPDASPAVSPDSDADDSDPDPGGVDDGGDESTRPGGGEEGVAGGDLEAGEARAGGADGTDGEQ